METTFQIILFVIALFMILLILVQKGKGGGLAGALGGPGGASAFGAKAGDAFTRITAYTALVWMAVCLLATVLMSGGTGTAGNNPLNNLKKTPAATAPATDDFSDANVDSSDANVDAELPATPETPASEDEK